MTAAWKTISRFRVRYPETGPAWTEWIIPGSPSGGGCGVK